MVYKIKKIKLPESENDSLIHCHQTSNSFKSLKNSLAVSGIIKDLIGATPYYSYGKLKVENKPLLIFIGNTEEIIEHFGKIKNNVIFIPIDTNKTVKSTLFDKKNKSFKIKFNNLNVYNCLKKDLFLNKESDFLVRKNNNILLKNNLLEIYFDEVFGSLSGTTNPNTICTIIRFFRILFGEFFPKIYFFQKHPVTIFTVDSEDQHNYFNNQKQVCTDISGKSTNRNDMRLDSALKTSLERFKKFKICPTFIITGSDLNKDSTDSFGNIISLPELNWNYLMKISKNKNVSIGTHAYNHQDWLSYGNSQNKAMSAKDRLLYFFDCGGNLSLLLKYLLSSLKLRFQNKEGVLGRNGEFTEKILEGQIRKLEKILEKNEIPFTKFHRSPGFRRSSKVIEYLDKHGYMDSSDLFNIEDFNGPPVPYSLFMLKNETLSLSKVKEFPCLFIDKYLRTTKKNIIDNLIGFLNDVFTYNETVLTIISHTKVTGGDYKHCHIYPRNPLSGLSQPANPKNIELIYSKISKQSRSITISQFLK